MWRALLLFYGGGLAIATAIVAFTFAEFTEAGRDVRIRLDAYR